MTKHDLKELAAMGAELGAAKAEVERLRALLREAAKFIDTGDMRDLNMIEVHAALSQQAEPYELDYSYHSHEFAKAQAEPTDTHTAVDMVTAAAQGFRDGQAAVEQAPAQDERYQFDGAVLRSGTGEYLAEFLGYRQDFIDSLLARPAQPEQHPVAVPQCVRDWYDAKAAHIAAVDAYNARLAFVQKHEPFGTSVNPEYKIMEAAEREARSLIGPMFTGLTEFFAAPIAQTAPQPEQSGLTEALNSLLSWAERQICTHEETHRGGAIWEICDACNAKWADDEGGKPEFKWPAAIEQARAALSAQGATND